MDRFTPNGYDAYAGAIAPTPEPRWVHLYCPTCYMVLQRVQDPESESLWCGNCGREIDSGEPFSTEAACWRQQMAYRETQDAVALNTPWGRKWVLTPSEARLLALHLLAAADKEHGTTPELYALDQEGSEDTYHLWNILRLAHIDHRNRLFPVSRR